VTTPAFDFGENWSEFSQHALTAERTSQARGHFGQLIGDLPLAGKSFLDIGFGQGLGLLTATACGARAVGCDINPKCAQVLERNRSHFPDLPALPSVVVGSILDEKVLEDLRRHAGRADGYDLVHSWGVLHHTGDMDRAIQNAASLVAPGGHFILAIYNRHWSSLPWRVIKRCYVTSPRWVQRVLIRIFFPIIYVAKWLVTGRNPRQQERGMDFYYDVIDWVGGYPYEYASRREIEVRLTPQGFSLLRFHAARVPTGCNEFVFRRSG
jgi:2-polyprenyl-3-methyl-5-hydroxy-6-metoxy-1,4-benzoquinol methylase